MKRIGISTKMNDPRAGRLAVELRDWLLARDCTVVMDEQLDATDSTLCQPLDEMAGDIELMVTLGGDGTLLHVGRRFIGSGVPILGINLGRLGFLTDTPVGNMFDVVADVLAGNFSTKRHFSLRAETWRGDERISCGSAINDVVVQRSLHPRMIGFEMYVQDQFVLRMRGDGIILATPAGSTAYAMSAGGAILHPGVDAVAVVPVCPHTLSNRPIVLPAEDSIELHLVESPAPAALNLDGQEHVALQLGDRVVVEKGDDIVLAHPLNRHYFEVLRSKLHWAGQVEND